MSSSGQELIDPASWSMRRSAVAPQSARSLSSGQFSDNVSVLEAAPGRRASAEREALERTVKLDVIPRLARAFDERKPRAGEEDPVFPPVADFARFVLTCDASSAAAFVATLDGSISVERLHLDLLAPTARHLGDLWNEDLCDFTDVTLGVGRLQQIMRAFSPSSVTVASPKAAGRALLLAFAGEQHTFGLTMLAEFFRRAGWWVKSDAGVAAGASARLAGREWFEIVGFSVGSETRLDAVALAISQVRRASRNPAIGVLVGGALFHDDAALALQVGADGTAVDGRQATVQAQTLMDRQPAGE